ncbi:BURP domain-containing protein [Staphylococcus aureus]|uniref:BURP domain-containing protein n=1 Tax=Staphylococcus aureus TaxID=1280 RepID=UPI0013DD6E6E|nr:BURP domain-containing protein [Staphylococcus aureus]
MANGHFRLDAFKKSYGNRHYGIVESQKVIVPDEATFFLEKDLQHGQKLRLDLTRSAPTMAFLPRGAANAIPFSSEKLPTILNLFSIQPNSVVAKQMKQVLSRCEVQDPSEKSKHCATSLESMVDYVTATLGTHDVRTVSLEVEKGAASSQQYMVPQSPHMQEAAEESYVVCHPELWPYAVFYCHVTPVTRAYVVGLTGEDGTRVDAVAVCHMDTSSWNPKHLAFEVTKVKPGTVPICHLLPQGDIVWAPQTKGSQIP